MIVIDKTLDVAWHDESSLSIKDFSSEIDLSENKWNNLFSYMLNQSDDYYFLGERPFIVTESLKENLFMFSDSDILVNDYFKICIKIKPSNIYLNRQRLAEIWEIYESAGIIFLKDSKDNYDINFICESKNLSYKKIVELLPNSYLIFKGIEQDVLWIEKGINMPPLNIFQ